MTRIEFRAPEYHADASFGEAHYSFEGSPSAGWTIERNGQPHLRLGSGYRLLRTEQCGVCSTDLSRHFLPFPLPQVTGHELIGTDEGGRRFVVEINASHHARGLAGDCLFCQQGLHRHCPERVVLGIHDLPGGFGPFILAPVRAVIPIPEGVPAGAAVLVEPFAAALNAVTTVAPKAGEQIAVLGPRRLGMLVVAALRAFRDREGADFEILALSRHDELLELSRRFGASDTKRVVGTGDDLEGGLADVVIDTTGSPSGLVLALRLSRREVHVKSTHGQPTAGVKHLTELVVDELAVAPFPKAKEESRWRRAERDSGARARVAWLADSNPPPWMCSVADLSQGSRAADVLSAVEAAAGPGLLPRADFAVIDSAAGLDDVIRPVAGRETSLVRPRGEIFIHDAAERGSSPLIDAVAERRLRLSSSRCGDFRQALEWMAADARLSRIGEDLITHRFPSSAIGEAFRAARSPECIKAVIDHPVE